jgi:hypothetical protein
VRNDVEKVVVTFADGTSKTYKGRGYELPNITEVKVESWVKDEKTGKPKKEVTAQPFHQIVIAITIPPEPASTTPSSH